MSVIVFLLECLAAICIILIIVKILQKFFESNEE
jgi:hypothetical protein